MSQSYEPSYTTDPTQPKDPRSLGEIVGDITTDLSTLVKQELEMAKTELRQEASTAGRGVGMLAGAALAGLLLMIFASLALTWLLDNWLPVEAAALIVAAIWAIVAGALASAGRTALKKSNPQLPQTQQTLKEDAAWARAQKN